MQLPTLKPNWKLYAAGAALVAALVALLCWWLWAPAPPKPETYKPAVKQSDGSVVLERKPDPAAQPKQIIPAGTKLERVESVTVRPHPVVIPPPQTAVEQGPTTPQPAAETQCPDVTVDLSLVRNGDGTRRVVASSPDGDVVGGVDIPVEAAAPPPKPKLWAAGAVADPLRRTWGAFVDRDIAFARVGVQVNQRSEGDMPNQLWVKVGARF